MVRFFSSLIIAGLHQLRKEGERLNSLKSICVIVSDSGFTLVNC
uniref:Uncharacterized protein n=1 Tax=Setaria italica TaxID=4555 RepID=K4AP68_SETIT